MGMGGGTERQGGGMRGMGMPGRGMPGMGLPGNRPGGASTNTVKMPELMDVDKIANEQNIHFADRLYPVRMAIVSGAFPFKDQLESFRIALRKRNLNELMSILDTPDAPWQFDGLDIDRRVLHLDGREKFPWQRYDDKMREALKLYL